MAGRWRRRIKPTAARRKVDKGGEAHPPTAAVGYIQLPPYDILPRSVRLRFGGYASGFSVHVFLRVVWMSRLLTRERAVCWFTFEHRESIGLQVHIPRRLECRLWPAFRRAITWRTPAGSLFFIFLWVFSFGLWLRWLRFWRVRFGSVVGRVRCR